MLQRFAPLSWTYSPIFFSQMATLNEKHLKKAFWQITSRLQAAFIKCCEQGWWKVSECVCLIGKKGRKGVTMGSFEEVTSTSTTSTWPNISQFRSQYIWWLVFLNDIKFVDHGILRLWNSSGGVPLLQGQPPRSWMHVCMHARDGYGFYPSDTSLMICGTECLTMRALQIGKCRPLCWVACPTKFLGQLAIKEFELQVRFRIKIETVIKIFKAKCFLFCIYKSGRVLKVCYANRPDSFLKNPIPSLLE